MSSFFAAVGMPMESGEEVRSLLGKVEKYDFELYPFSEGKYLRWSCESGAELWIHLDNDDQFLDMAPFFQGSTSIQAALKKPVRSLVDTPFAGSIAANVPQERPSKDKSGKGDTSDPSEVNNEVPFVFQLMDRGLYGQLDFPFESPVRLVAFATDVRAYGSEQEFRESQSEYTHEIEHEGEKAEVNVSIGSEFFAPSGLMMGDPPRPLADFNAPVLETSKLTNGLTGEAFYWARVPILGGTIDVVSAPETLDQPLVTDGIISGSFWIGGRILEPKIKQQGFLKKLFGR